MKATPNETNDLDGSEDPGFQMDYSPVEGLLHKYEMGLMYVVSTCSAHCRFCYREELIGRKEIERADGTVAKKRDGFSELQQSVREEISKQFTSPSHRARHQDESVAPVQLKIEDAVHAAFDALTPECIKAMAMPIVVAKNVWILSGETSMAGAIALASGLSMIRPNVRLVQEHSASRDLCGALADDVAVVFDFSRYRRNSVIAARTLADLDVPIVAITDGPLSPLSSLTENRCELDVPAVGPFDSSVPAVLAAELLVSQVVTELGDEALNRIDRLEVFWQATDTFLVTSPPTKP